MEQILIVEDDKHISELIRRSGVFGKRNCAFNWEVSRSM